MSNTKPLYDLGAAEIRDHLSMAGNPDKVMDIMVDSFAVIARVDNSNAAELINLEYVLRVMSSEVKHRIENLEKKTGQKYQLL